MMTIRLQKLTLKNFKGIENFVFEPFGENATVSGQNGSGKTSLADAFLWLLYGKDTRGAKLNPKTLDENNQEKLGLEPTVEADLIIDGKAVNLKRVQEEKWTTPRGQLEAVRTSDTTKYYIKGVPTLEKNWKEFLGKFGPESAFQFLLDSTSFMKMNWKERRKILVNMTDLSDEEIIANDPDLKRIELIIKEHSIDDYRKILTSQKKEIKRKIEGIPARIQEVTDIANKLKAEIKAVAKEELQEQILEHEADISNFESKLGALQAGNITLDYQEELSNLKIKLAEAQSAYMASMNMEVRSLQDDLNKQQLIVNDLKNKKADLEIKLRVTDNKIEEMNAFLASHLEKYYALKATNFDEHQKMCPTCSQELPANQVDTLIAKFNQDKAIALEKNIETGKSGKEKLILCEEEKKQFENELVLVAESYTSAQNLLNKLNDELANIQNPAQKFEDNANYKAIQEEISLIQQKILNATSDTASAEQELKNKIRKHRENIAGIQALLKRSDSLKDFENRISELTAEDSSLKAQNQEVERNLFLLDEFTRKKVSALEESINSKFELVKFKLFNVLKNGGLEEVCEATYNGIEYGTSLNTGARINCDLDIINTLIKEFGVSVPVFVDNAESVNELHKINSQMIELRVSENKNLKVEV